jgi:hypothetical protein
MTKPRPGTAAGTGTGTGTVMVAAGGMVAGGLMAWVPAGA